MTFGNAQDWAGHIFNRKKVWVLLGNGRGDKKILELRGIEPRASHMQSERSTTELQPLIIKLVQIVIIIIFISSLINY